MLSRKNRISTTEFPSFKDKGIRFVSALFSGTFYSSTQGVRISVVVSKKTAKSAVERNRLRRRVYAAIEPYLKRFTQGALVVIYPKIEAIRSPLPLLQEEIESSLRKVKILA